MEDRYLFKAKRLDSEEWVTGSLITCEDGTYKIATSCGYRLEEYFDTNACYCKQCGKKIKIVGGRVDG